MIEPKRVEVRNIITASNHTLVIPNFQRGYDWGKEEAEEMWLDLESSRDEGKPLFLGTVVLDISETKEKQSIKIVDGQQRLTTIFIFLSACRCVANALNDIDQAKAIQQKMTFIDDTTGKARGSRLVVSTAVKDVFDETIVNGDWDGIFSSTKRKRQVKKIKPVFDLFHQKIQKAAKNSGGLSKILSTLYDANFIQIEIENTQEAFDIFERTNARGLELNAADLLKNYLFSQASTGPSDIQVADLEDRWNQIVENGAGNIPKMMKYFWVSKFGYIQKKELYDRLKGYGKLVGAEKLLDELEAFSAIYGAMVKATDVEISEWILKGDIDELKKEECVEMISVAFHALRLFRVTQVYPLVISTYLRLVKEEGKDRGKAAKAFLDFLKRIENYHFINSAICQKPGNEVERYYADCCKNVSLAEKPILQEFAGIEKELKARQEKYSNFEGRFKELAYEEGESNSIIYYIFDRLNNFERRGGQRIKIYQPDHRLVRRNYSIEHVLSQNPSGLGFSKEEVADVVHNIGNLLIISYYTNSGELLNKPIREKIDILKEKQMQLPTVKKFVEEYQDFDWDGVSVYKKEISKRALLIANEAYKKVWKL